MKPSWILLLSGPFILAGCGFQPAASPTLALPVQTDCQQTGTVAYERVDSPVQGFPYDFGVYLPPCYDNHPDQRYPLLYLVPGRSSAPATWFEGAGAVATADRMIAAGEIPPFLMVATSNTDSDAFAEAIQDDLMPYIERTYRAMPDRQHRTVAGGSLGGIAAYRIVFSHPERYAALGIFGSGLVAGEEPRAQAWLAAIPAADKPRVFFNCGFQDDYMLSRARVLIAMLDQYGITHTEIFTDGVHAYSYWAGQVPDFFRWMAAGW
jgi:enterochelin esterase-like enzyme